MPLFVAIILGIVEGITEYLPVSSTGHLVLVGHLMGLRDDDPATSSFEIVVQLGAILAVVAHYRGLLADRVRGLLSRDPAALRLAGALIVAFVPTAVAGLLLRKTIKAHLFGSTPVAIALVAGGIAMIVVERIRARRNVKGVEGLEHVTLRRAFAIGLGQCLSLCPGTSRAMCTIVTGQLVGLSTGTAAEFSFLLALPTLGAATLYEGYKGRDVLLSHVGGVSMVAGLVSLILRRVGRHRHVLALLAHARARAVRVVSRRARYDRFVGPRPIARVCWRRRWTFDRDAPTHHSEGVLNGPNPNPPFIARTQRRCLRSRRRVRSGCLRQERSDPQLYGYEWPVPRRSSNTRHPRLHGYFDGSR